MPRGDLAMNKFNNPKGPKAGWMPPSHNCVWVPSRDKKCEEQRAKSFKDAFGSENANREIDKPRWCTCDMYEKIIDGKLYIIKNDCPTHGKGSKTPIKITDVNDPTVSTWGHKRFKRQLNRQVRYGNEPFNIEKLAKDSGR